MKKWLMLALALFLLTACNNTDDSKKTENMKASTESTEDTDAVGFEVFGDEIEEATNIPEEEEAAILSAFEEYVASFNAKDIDRYVQTLSKNPKGFEYEEDINTVKQVFTEYNVNRIATDTTIVKYSDEEVQVYANLDIEMTEIETNTKVTDNGRQVTVFVKEDDAWKVTSVYYIGNNTVQ